jgi:peptidoglycan hydrolase-like protein with peptidoglycan-binding domain
MLRILTPPFVLHSHEEFAMKLATRLAIIALTAAPLAAMAQSEQGLTRTQVKQDLQRLEQAGYNPSERDAFYPNDIQAAEAKVDSQNAYGGASSNGTSASGHTMSTTPLGQTPQ